MKKTAFIILGLVMAFCFGFFFNWIISIRPEKTTIKQTENPIEMKRVTGIGGIFFKCKNPVKVKEWYKTHLGFETNQFGASFEWQEGTNPTKKESLQWSPFAETTTYFEPSTKDFMINYRVAYLESLVKLLKKENVTILDKIETYEYGKFIHIMDIEGNKIELYEPNYEKGKNAKSGTK